MNSVEVTNISLDNIYMFILQHHLEKILPSRKIRLGKYIDSCER